MCQMKQIDEFKSLPELIMYFSTEAVCLKYLEQWVHKGNIRCQYCGTDKVYRFKDGKRFRCSSCLEYFTAKVGTIFESSKLPLVKWYTAIYLLSAHKKGVSSHQLARDLHVTQKTGWFMLHRIRKAMEQDSIMMDGIVEADETFIGGKNKNRHKNKKFKNAQGRSFQDKVAVMGLLQREGKVKTVVIGNTQGENIRRVVFGNVQTGSTLISDEWWAYRNMKEYYHHEVVDHARGQYVNGNGATTNSMEGFWAHLKRSLGGIYHRVSPKHLQKYIDEITFRWNTRKMNEGQRLSLLMSKVNCRLKYKQLVYE